MNEYWMLRSTVFDTKQSPHDCFAALITPCGIFVYDDKEEFEEGHPTFYPMSRIDEAIGIRASLDDVKFAAAATV